MQEPVTFGAVGLKYEMVESGKAHPYLMVGGGMARVKQNVTFSVGGTDVTGSLQQSPYFVTLGTDLSGAFNKPMLTLGAGVAWPVWKRLVLDFQYRYGRIFADDQVVQVLADAGDHLAPQLVDGVFGLDSRESLQAPGDEEGLAGERQALARTA